MVEDSIEASELGWAPGYWPLQFRWKGKLYKKGQNLFNAEELYGIEYVAVDGDKVAVFND